jgi:RNA polymerase sigma factor (sigma-70 family)
LYITENYLSLNLNIESNDNDLISGFLNGENTAFNYIVLKYQKRIYAVVRKMVQNHDDADDITQEVFVKLHGSLKDFRGESALFTYLYKMAVNFSLNHLKKNKINRERTLQVGDIQEISSGDKNYDSVYDDDRKAKVISEAIAGLPEQQRLVFSLKFYDDLTYNEISGILNKPVGTLKANYFHAFNKIKDFFEKNKIQYSI